jgi:DNA-binding CsgD family transcriptional regulator
MEQIRSVRGGGALSLLDREPELALIEGWLSGARDGRGGLALVLGGAGLGKTVLLERAVALAQSNGMLALTARAGELEREMPFGVARQLFATVVRALGPEERRAVMIGAASSVRALLGLVGAETASADPLGALHGLYWLLANLSDRTPLLLVVDDLHWVDPQTARWLSYLSGRVSELPVLVIAAARSSEQSGEQRVAAIAEDDRTRTIRLEPLGFEAVSELVRSEFGAGGDVGFVEACHAATGGNPFFVMELLRAALSDGIEPVESQALKVPQLGPKEVARAILVRLARLGDSAGRLAKSVAVLGADAELRHAAALSAMRTDQALEIWDELVRGEVLQPQQPLEFIHPIARAAVYSELATGERTQAHRRAAEILADDRAEPERIATHAHACEPAGDPRVVSWLRAAARAATAAGAPDGAALYLRRALQEPPVPGLRAAVHFELGSVMIGVDSPTAATEYQQAAAATADRQLRLRALRWCGTALAYAGRIADSVAAFDAAIELAPDPDAALHLAATRDFYAAWWGDIPNRAAFQSHLQERVVDLDGTGAGARRARAVAAVSICITGTGTATRALELAERAGPAGPMRPDLEEGDETHAAVGAVRIVCDDVRPSIFESQLIAGAKQGWILSAARSHRASAILELRRGALLSAEAHARASWEILATRRDASAALYWWSAAVLVDVLIARGAVDEADTIAMSTGLGTTPMDQVIFPWPPVVLGELELARGNTEAGIKILLAAGDWLDRHGVTNPSFIPWRALVAPALMNLGRVDEARQVISPAVQRAREFGAPWGLGMALRAAGTVEPQARGIPLLQEAVGVLERSPCRLELAHALLELGGSLRRTRHRAQAREHLRTALDLTHRCGALGLANRAKQELAATGARPRRAMLAGVESLTASERRVAELAARGLSNPEIAQQLFVTRKTVETHLGHVYQKLEIDSRAHIAEALRAEPRD